MELRILELFSGIGGMHYAFKYINFPGSVIAAIDINSVANDVYAVNFPTTRILNNNIEKLKAEMITALKINMILMSPPCQPHTRQGNHHDIQDCRSKALNHICFILPQCNSVEYILMENVRGFEKSEARILFCEALMKSDFYYREFLVSPSQLGIPNTRYRYYCLARKLKDFSFPARDDCWQQFPNDVTLKYETVEINKILESSEAEVPLKFYLDDKVLLRRVFLMDIVTSTSTNSICFTKSYTRYYEGTGSVFSSLSQQEINEIFSEMQTHCESNNSLDIEERKCALLRKLCLRYFTPLEVSRLMSFPDNFSFPPKISDKQKYRLLGNSINVRVVGELIKVLLK